MAELKGTVPRAIIRNNLNKRQIKFCEEYLRNGRKGGAAAKYAGYERQPYSRSSALLKDPKIKDYLNSRVQEVIEVVRLDYDFKIKKLKQIIDIAIPDNLERITKEVVVGLQALAEANKMQGHYSAEKHVNLNANIDLTPEQKEALQLIASLRKQYERDY